jgi:hypothetical protein
MDGAAEVKPPLGAVREDWLKVAVEGRGGAGGGEAEARMEMGKAGEEGTEMGAAKRCG